MKQDRNISIHEESSGPQQGKAQSSNQRVGANHQRDDNGEENVAHDEYREKEEAKKTQNNA